MREFDLRPAFKGIKTRRAALLEEKISKFDLRPAFKGIKTPRSCAIRAVVRFDLRPAFKGIKTLPRRVTRGRCRVRSETRF